MGTGGAGGSVGLCTKVMWPLWAYTKVIQALGT